MPMSNEQIAGKYWKKLIEFRAGQHKGQASNIVQEIIDEATTDRDDENERLLKDNKHYKALQKKAVSDIADKTKRIEELVDLLERLEQGYMDNSKESVPKQSLWRDHNINGATYIRAVLDQERTE